MPDIDYYEAFGLEKPAEGQPAEEPEQEAGEQGAEAAETAQEPEEGPGDAAPEEAAQGAQEAEKGQSREENARYAKARREAERERDAGIAKAKEDAAKELDAFVAGMGLVNPYTKQPIKTRAEYDAYKAAHAEKQKETFMSKQGMSDAEYQQMIDGLPEVQAAREQAAEAERVTQENRRAQMQAQLEREIAQIAAIDPTVKSLDDLVGLESYPKIYERVNQGMSVYDAWRLENMDAIMEAGRKGAQQQAAANLGSKDHMRATKPRGEGSQMKAVPEDVMQMYRAINPGATDEQIMKHYNHR